MTKGTKIINKGMSQFTAGLELMKKGISANQQVISDNQSKMDELAAENTVLEVANNETNTVISNFESLILNKK